MERLSMVKIYQKPLTEEDYEGKAKLLEKLHEDNEAEAWMVQFSDGIKVERSIKKEIT